MGRRARGARACAAVLFAAVALAVAVPAHAKTERIDQSCARVGPVVAGGSTVQTFTPTVDTVTRFQVPLRFQRDWSGTVTGGVSLRPPADTAAASMRAHTLGEVTVHLSGHAGETKLVEFLMPSPVAIDRTLRSVPGVWYSLDVGLPEAVQGPVIEFPVRWWTCDDYYGNGRPFWSYSPRRAAAWAASIANAWRPGSIAPDLVPAGPAILEPLPARAMWFQTYGY